jgi:hypothetical protein
VSLKAIQDAWRISGESLPWPGHAYDKNPDSLRGVSQLRASMICRIDEEEKEVQA